MKTDPIKPASQKVEHAPVVIHQHEDETVLERWLREGMAAGARFWVGIALAIALVAGAVIAFTTISTTDPKLAQSWTELALANDAEAQLKVAEEFPNTPAARWAKLRAAAERFNEAVDKFPTDRDAASGLLSTAKELYEEIAAGPNQNPETRAAALGVARVLETRGELTKAIAQYDKVASTWPNTDEADEAKRLAELLNKPESREFYKQLYTYVPTKPKFPGGGDVPELFRPMIPRNDKLPPVFEEDDKQGASSDAKDQAKTSLPDDVFTPSKSAEPKPAPTKTEDQKPKK